MNPLFLVPLLFATALPSILAQDPLPAPTPRQATDTADRTFVPADREPVWTAFRDRRPGDWHAYWNHATGTPSAVFGPGITLADWRGNTVEEARRHALALLDAERELLGLDGLDLREAIAARMGRLWSFKFDLAYRGLPLVGGRADVRVGMQGRIAMFGSVAVAMPADFVTTPAITSEAASILALHALAQPLAANPGASAPPAPRLVVWADVTAGQRRAPQLAWEVAVSNLDADGSGAIGRYYVDAQNGAVLDFVNDKHACGAGCAHPSHGPAAGIAPDRPVADAPAAAPTVAVPPLATTVTVLGYVRTGLSPGGLFPSLVPMRGLEVNVPGVGVRTTNANGEIQFDISAPVTITIGALDGRHHKAISGASAPNASSTVQPGANQSIVLLNLAANAAQLAHTNSAYWVDRVNEWARGILGNTPQMATASNVDVAVNIASTCNAYYNPNTNSINFYAAGGGCANSAYSTVIAHEWGHGLDDRFGDISQTQGLSEGWADIVAMYLVDDPDVGLGFQTSGVPLRTGLNVRQFPVPTSNAVHDQGEPWMGFAWKLRERLAVALNSRSQAIARSNEIVLGSIVADAVDQPGAVLEVFLADDDDAMLNNGTPNAPSIVFACGQHALPMPPLTGPTNDYCAGAIAVVHGVNGPYSNAGASSLMSSWNCGAPASNADVWFKFTTQWPGQLTVRTCGQTTLDTKLQLLSGSCGALAVLACNDNSCGTQSSIGPVSVQPGTYFIQAGATTVGSFSLDVDFAGPIAAASQSQGVGCGAASKAFYEFFPANGFDLGGQSMRLRNMGTHYVAEPGGSFLPLTGNTVQTSHGDDTVLNFVLSVPMPYPGGASQFLEVCSNGFVSVGAGNGALASPTVSAWLASARARWGTWRDFNPAAAGSGKIHHDIAGPIAYVTWNNVYTYATTTPCTWQIQFHQYTGDVTMVWQSMPQVPMPTLVGYAAQGPNNNLGSMDLSTAIPATFYTGAFNGSPLALAGTLPQLGTTLTLTTSSFPSNSPVGLQLLGVQGYLGGIDLAALGMPGCRQYSEALVIGTLAPAGGQAVYTMPIPSQLNLAGFQLKAQSAALVAGYNAGGFTTSNGVWMTVGI
ncbi:MAG: hypothetical protein ACK533_14360 [Planctomycetota bacterium]